MTRIILLDFKQNRTEKTKRQLGLLTFCIVFFIGQMSFAQCINPWAYTTQTSNNSGDPQNGVNCLFADEYETWNGLLVGSNYMFKATSGTDAYCTVTDTNNNVIAHGQSPLFVNAITASSVRLHVNTDAACGSGGGCHSTQIQMLLSCPVGDVVLTTQTEVYEFAINYPDCTELQFLRIGDLLDNSNITNLTPLSNLTYIGHLDIVNNPQLTSISGLSSLTSVGGLTVRMNPQLTSISGLNSLTSVEVLDFHWNEALTSLSGLENLTSAPQINIFYNPQLSDISALQNIDPDTIGGTIYHEDGNEYHYGLEIRMNSLLEVCNLSNFCTYLQGTGYRSIEDNGGNCIDEQAILNACSLSVDDNTFSEVKIYPNPVKNILHFSQEVHKIMITDLTGKVFSILHNVSQTDMSALQNGVYLVVVEQENDTKEIRKIVKQ